MKNILIKRFGEEICFAYPKSKRKSQVFFLNSIQKSDVVTTVHDSDPIKATAKVLREECKQCEFKDLQDSYKNAEDIEISLNSYKEEGLESWDKFFNEMFPYRKESSIMRRKCDTIFQIVYNMVHDSSKVSPLSILVSESLHDLTKSKKLIEIFNRLGISINYKAMQNIDANTSKRIIDSAGENRVPVVESIIEDLLNGVMDNFDHEENTPSGKSISLFHISALEQYYLDGGNFSSRR